MLGAVVLQLLVAAAASAQVPTGYVSLFGDYFPNRSDTTELRAPAICRREGGEGTRLEPCRSHGLGVSSKGCSGAAGRARTAAAACRRSTAASRAFTTRNVDILTKRVDFLVGYARIVWGKLDEIQPTDVINPLDVSPFFFEGRSEARLPVLVGRVRLHLSENLTLDGVYLPDFRRGRFDQLDEPSSPFNLPVEVQGEPVACLAMGCPTPGAIVVSEQAPAFTFKNAQGGARVSATTGRVD